MPKFVLRIFDWLPGFLTGIYAWVVGLLLKCRARLKGTDWMLVFTAVLAFVAVLQWRTTDLQRSITQTDERAWISASIDLTPEERAERKLELGFEGTPVATVYYPNIGIKLTNTGKTPAQNIFSKVLVEIQSRQRPVRLECVDDPNDTCQASSVTYGIIFPSDKMVNNQAHRVRPFTDDEVRLWNEGEDYLTIFGVVTYADVFGVKHETRFCFWFVNPNAPRKDRSFDARTCVAYNRAS
jgi:hypothetical protein